MPAGYKMEDPSTTAIANEAPVRIVDRRVSSDGKTTIVLEIQPGVLTSDFTIQFIANEADDGPGPESPNTYSPDSDVYFDTHAFNSELPAPADLTDQALTSPSTVTHEVAHEPQIRHPHLPAGRRSLNRGSACEQGSSYESEAYCTPPNDSADSSLDQPSSSIAVSSGSSPRFTSFERQTINEHRRILARIIEQFMPALIKDFAADEPSRPEIESFWCRLADKFNLNSCQEPVESDYVLKLFRRMLQAYSTAYTNNVSHQIVCLEANTHDIVHRVFINDKLFALAGLSANQIKQIRHAYQGYCA